MTTVALYELGDARVILETWLLETEGEVTAELEQLLAELDADADAKIERVALYIREQLARAEAVKIEAQRLIKMQRASENAADGLKRYLEREMERLGKDKVKGDLCTVAMQKNAPVLRGELTSDQVRSLDPTAFPYVQIIPETWALDRRAALAHAKAGFELPVGLSVEQSSSLRIR